MIRSDHPAFQSCSWGLRLFSWWQRLFVERPGRGWTCTENTSAGSASALYNRRTDSDWYSECSESGLWPRPASPATAVVRVSVAQAELPPLQCSRRDLWCQHLPGIAAGSCPVAMPGCCFSMHGCSSTRAILRIYLISLWSLRALRMHNIAIQTQIVILRSYSKKPLSKCLGGF